MVSVLVYVDLVFKILQNTEMWMNDEFGKEFPVGDLLALVPEIIGAILITLYVALKDQRWVRKMIPWAFLLISVANVLIPSWIMIYIYAIYQKDEVHNNSNLAGDP